MNSDEKREVFHAAVDLLVDRRVAEIKPTSAGAYAAKTRTALRSEHRDAAREMFDAYDDLGTAIDAAQLADLLEPPRPAPVAKGCPSCSKGEPAPPALPTYDTEAWKARDADEGLSLEQTRTRIAQIREALTHKETA